MTLRQFLLAQGYQKIKLTKSKTGHLYMEAQINGTTGLFILDTGAGATVIDMNKKTQFSLTGKVSKHLASGAGGGGMAIEVAKNCHFRMGKYICAGIKLNLLDLGHVNTALKSEGSPQIDGIIGSDILVLTNSIIDYKKLGLYLK